MVVFMYFGKQFKEYREEYLGLKQLEAARCLKIDPAALSNYERSERAFPIDLLPVVKEAFQIPDDYFLAMILGQPLKAVRPEELSSQPEKAQELKAHYLDSFIETHRELLENDAELRELIALVANFNEKDRRNYLNAHKSLLSLFQKLVD